jgi:hypothetical protein
MLNINQDDRVWFYWKDTSKPLNIRQMTHDNKIVPNGFLSGSLIEPPGVYMRTFRETGINYYKSDNVKDLIGAVIVLPKPNVNECF